MNEDIKKLLISVKELLANRHVRYSDHDHESLRLEVLERIEKMLTSASEDDTVVTIEAEYENESGTEKAKVHLPVIK